MHNVLEEITYDDQECIESNCDKLEVFQKVKKSLQGSFKIMNKKNTEVESHNKGLK